MKFVDTARAGEAVARHPENDARWSLLARDAARGHPASLRELVSDLSPRVRRLVRHLVHGRGDVDDLSQDALLIILQALDSYRGDGPFRAWADRVVARSVFSARRAALRRAERRLSEHDLSSDPAALPDRRYLGREVVECLGELPRAQRDALVLHHVVGLSVSEAASELGVQKETLRSRIRLGRDELRKRLAHEP